MRIALAGNPNSGKTTMYNALTGRSEKVGNWAGVTVEKKEHPIKRSFYSGEPITVIRHRKGGSVVAIKDGRYNIDNQLSDAIIVE